MNWLTPSVEIEPQPKLTKWAWLGLGLWIATVGAGWAALTHYANQPGRTSPAPMTVLRPGTTGRDQLLLFVHPRCPCSMATVRELGRLMARSNSALEATVYFFRPETESD